MHSTWKCNPIDRIRLVKRSEIENTKFAQRQINFVLSYVFLYNTKLNTSLLSDQKMALSSKQIAELLKMRALGFNQAEIAKALDTSQQVIAYQLKKLKEQATKKGTDEVFSSALIGGLAGAAAGIGLIAILELLNGQKD